MDSIISFYLLFWNNSMSVGKFRQIVLLLVFHTIPDSPNVMGIFSLFTIWGEFNNYLKRKLKICNVYI